MNYPQIKRLLDVFFSLALLVLLFPAIVGISLAVWIFDGWPVFFPQGRIGLDNQPFKLYKFRTMSSEEPESHDSSRITKLGKYLRRFSLDEIPQLINVLRGEMSFVGPRPLLTSYLSLYTPEQRRRHSLRPGMTGLAQVNGRNGIPWHKRIELDLRYVDNSSLGLDCAIVFRTLFVLASGRGLQVTAEKTSDLFEP